MKPKLIIGLCLVMALVTCGTASAWLDGYQYRKPITLTAGASGAQTDYQMNYTVVYDTDMQSDFDDLRFTQLDGETILDAWLESKTDGVSAVVWVETATPAVAADIYMYYGNVTAVNYWSIGDTFLFGDECTGSDGDNINSAIWDTYLTSGATAKILSNEAYLKIPGDDSWASMDSKNSDSWAFKYTFEGVASSQLYGSNSIGTGHISSDRTHDDGYFVNYRTNWGGSSITLFKRISGVSTQIDTTASYFAINTEYEIEWLVTPTKVQFIVDGNVLLESTNTMAFAGGSLEESTHQGAATGGSYVDYAFGRKYVSGPATHAFGSEEEYIPPYVPSITAFNNITGSQSHVPLSHGTTVLFNATASYVSTWTWTLDGIDQSTPYDNYTHTFSDGFGYYAVTVTAANARGSDTYTWGIWENIETTAETIPTFTDTSYQMLLDSIDYPPDMEDFGKALAHPFVQMVGVIFYLFIFGIPLTMMYIRQDNMTLPTTLLLLFGSIIIFMLPPQWQIIAGALMTLGFVGILFKLYKERER